MLCHYPQFWKRYLRGTATKRLPIGYEQSGERVLKSLRDLRTTSRRRSISFSHAATGEMWVMTRHLCRFTGGFSSATKNKTDVPHGEPK
jgi:hypothetical protein